MAIFNFKILLYSLSISFFCILFPQTTSLTFNRFNLTNLTLPDQRAKIKTFGDAIFSTQGLQLTDLVLGQVGKATYIDLLHLWDNSTSSRTLTDFSTHFVFVCDSEGKNSFADGLAFFLAPNGSQSGGLGGTMGLPLKPPNWRERSDNFVAVEFDTFMNMVEGWEPGTIGQSPHVGIDVNSLVSNVSAIWYANHGIINGMQNEAWISYNSSSKNLSVVFTSSTDITTIHLIIDLRDYLPEWVEFGFSAESGWAWDEKNTVKSWEFSTSLEITVNTGNRNVTDPVKTGSTKISLGAVVGLVVGSVVLVGLLVLVGFGLWRRSRAKEEDESEVDKLMENEFESSAGPKKFPYGQLSQATNNFEEEQKLGQGGFGGVYKGFLSELNSYIAVKRISKGSKQGIKEYAAEVKIISQLRHRNLVQLIGWCHEKKELLLVYEFMENASLDFHLFKGKSLLTWATRYKIAQGLASALLYLHEEWEQCVVHRDVKSGNVMLDSNFNAKLGDFGLARFVDHEKEPQTTALAGTMGYLAPECVVTGKASKESDVYSFGIVALEIACGRKPFDSKVPEPQMRLVEWVWDLYGMGRLLEAADPKLGPDFDEQEMERLMIVGLWCAHPDHNFRPKIRQAIHVLNFETPPPILPLKQPALSFFSPPLNTTTSSMTSQNKYSSYTSNTDSSNFTSSSTTSAPSISLLSEM